MAKRTKKILNKGGDGIDGVHTTQLQRKSANTQPTLALVAPNSNSEDRIGKIQTSIKKLQNNVEQNKKEANINSASIAHEVIVLKNKMKTIYDTDVPSLNLNIKNVQGEIKKTNESVGLRNTDLQKLKNDRVPQRKTSTQEQGAPAYPKTQTFVNGRVIATNQGTVAANGKVAAAKRIDSTQQRSVNATNPQRGPPTKLYRNTRFPTAVAAAQPTANNNQAPIPVRQNSNNANGNCTKLGGLINKANSCYVDSTLMALFHNKPDYIKKNILDVDLASKYKTNSSLLPVAKKIQANLNQSFKDIQGGKNFICGDLRQLFKEYDDIKNPTEKIDWKKTQQEPSDVIKILLSIFKIGDDCEYTMTSYGYDERYAKTKVTNANSKTNIADVIVSSADLYQLGNNNTDYDMKDLLPSSTETTNFNTTNLWTVNGKSFKKREEIKTYLKAPILIVQVNRNFNDEKIKTKVIPLPIVRIGDNALTLTSVICHHGNQTNSGHYTAFLLCKNEWYHYNDLKYSNDKIGKLEKIGNLEELKKLKMNTEDGFVLKNATMFVYTENKTKRRMDP